MENARIVVDDLCQTVGGEHCNGRDGMMVGSDWVCRSCDWAGTGAGDVRCHSPTGAGTGDQSFVVPILYGAGTGAGDVQCRSSTGAGTGARPWLGCPPSTGAGRSPPLYRDPSTICVPPIPSIIISLSYPILLFPFSYSLSPIPFPLFPFPISLFPTDRPPHRARSSPPSSSRRWRCRRRFVLRRRALRWRRRRSGGARTGARPG